MGATNYGGYGYGTQQQQQQQYGGSYSGEQEEMVLCM